MKKIKNTIAKWLVKIAHKLSPNVYTPDMDPLDDCKLYERQYDVRKARVVQTVPKHIIDGIIESERDQMLQTIIRNVKNRLIKEANWEDVVECEVRDSDCDSGCYIVEATINVLAPTSHGND